MSNPNSPMIPSNTVSGKVSPVKTKSQKKPVGIMRPKTRRKV